MADQRRVLITGAGGRIGQVLHRGLRDRYRLRVMYHARIPADTEGAEVFVGDIVDFGATLRATEGIETVVHMAGDPSGATPFPHLMALNVQGTYHVYEAARRNGVRRVVFASTNHVTGFYEKDGIYTTPEMPVRPDSLYGASKAFGEALARHYFDQHGLQSVCLRIGSFQPRPLNPRMLATWLSHRDAVQLVARGIEAEPVSFGIYYGISRNTRRTWDITNAIRELGYQPEDDAETYAGEFGG